MREGMHADLDMCSFTKHNFWSSTKNIFCFSIQKKSLFLHIEEILKTSKRKPPDIFLFYVKKIFCDIFDKEDLSVFYKKYLLVFYTEDLLVFYTEDLTVPKENFVVFYSFRSSIKETFWFSIQKTLRSQRKILVFSIKKSSVKKTS